MRKFTAAEVQAIIEADRSGRIHLEPRDYTDATLAAALKQYRDLPMVGTEAHPGYQHAWGKNALCIYKGCKAGPAELRAEMEQHTGHPYKASTTSPLCEVCGERKINRYGTHGLPGLEQGDQQAPAEWSGSQCPVDPDGCWIDDETEEHVNAKTAYRTAGHPVTA